MLDATYVYPTHGDRLLELAVDILEGKPYERDTRLMSALVTSSNARALQIQTEETMRQSAYLDQLHKLADNYLQQLSTQRTITFLAGGVIVLLLLVMVLFYLYHRGKITLRRERVVNNLWNMEQAQQPQQTQETHPQPLSEGKGEDTSIASTGVAGNDSSPSQGGPEGGSAETLGSAAPAGSSFVSPFITRFKEVVERRLSESELSVEDLAADMNLSRVQLYRKVKTISGSSPVELLRTARLNRGYQLLLTTDKSISEVAYAVGFTAPSYFTKCFREEFGQSPTDIRQ